MIGNGFAQSLEHPGGNVTGMDELPPGVTTTRLTLLKTAAPKVSRVAAIYQATLFAEAGGLMSWRQIWRINTERPRVMSTGS